MSEPSIEALDRLRVVLASALADHIGMPLVAVEAAVLEVTAGWFVEGQCMRPVSDPHDRFVIHTPWVPRRGPG